MKIKYADLHIHSRYSDGSYRVSDIFRSAKKNSIKCLSITDHDSTGSFNEAFELSINYGIEFIPGIELSAQYKGMDVHILGYFMDHNDRHLSEHLKLFSDSRIERAKKMIELMREDGININFDDIETLCPECTIARPHIAKVLMKKGYAYNFNDAFYKFLSTESKYYVDKYKISVKEAVDLIHSSGGLAILAHPLFLVDDPEIIFDMKKAGIDGMEVIHSSYNEQTLKLMETTAEKHGLLRSGGSDCHGGKKTGKKMLGRYNIPYEWVENMKQKLSGGQ